jgi:MFS family permease
MLQGVGEAPIWALAPALLSIQYPTEKGKFIGIYNASLHGGLVSGSLLGILTNKAWQGNESFLLFAGVAFAGGLLIALFVENPSQEGGAAAKVSLT